MRTNVSAAARSAYSKLERRNQNRCARSPSSRKTGRIGKEGSLTEARVSSFELRAEPNNLPMVCSRLGTHNSGLLYETHSLFQIRARPRRRDEHGGFARCAVGLPSPEQLSGFHAVRNAGG